MALPVTRTRRSGGNEGGKRKGRPSSPRSSESSKGSRLGPLLGLSKTIRGPWFRLRLGGLQGYDLSNMSTTRPGSHGVVSQAHAAPKGLFVGMGDRPSNSTSGKGTICRGRRDKDKITAGRSGRGQREDLVGEHAKTSLCDSAGPRGVRAGVDYQGQVGTGQVTSRLRPKIPGSTGSVGGRDRGGSTPGYSGDVGQECAVGIPIPILSTARDDHRQLRQGSSGDGPEPSRTGAGESETVGQSSEESLPVSKNDACGVRRRENCCSRIRGDFVTADGLSAASGAEGEHTRRNPEIQEEEGGNGSGDRSSNRQRQQARAISSPTIEVVPGLAIPTKGDSRTAAAEQSKGYQGGGTTTQVNNVSIRGSRSSIIETECSGGGGRQGDRTRSSSEPQAGVVLDSKVRREMHPSKGTAFPNATDWMIEDQVRSLRLPSAAYNDWMPSYTRFLQCSDPDAVFPYTGGSVGRPEGTRRDADLRRAPFAESVVNTVDPSGLRPWLTLAEWEVVEVITSPQAFRSRVLRVTGPAIQEEQQKVRSAALSEQQVKDLKAKGYIRRARRVRFRCSGFAVWKQDHIFARFIWNGVPFNNLCHPPPKFSITAMPQMLSRLLAPGVLWYLAWDFSTWFAELRVHPEVEEWFGLELRNGVWLVQGVPMGWAWACAIAQFLSIAIVRRLIDRLGWNQGDFVSEVCIDNCIVGVRREGVDQKETLRVLRETCMEFGAHLKESAIEMGHTVDWMCYRLNTSTKTATFKESFKEKLRRVAEQWSAGTIREAWGRVGAVLFGCHAAILPLSKMRETLEWIVSSSPASLTKWELQHHEAGHDESTIHGWDSRIVVPAEIGKQLTVMAEQLRDAVIFPPCQVGGYKAWIIADASTSGYDAYVCITPNSMVLKAYQGNGMIHIRELDVQFKALRRAERMLKKEGDVQGVTVLSFGDNNTANAAIRRGYAMWYTDADAEFERMKRSGSHIDIHRVDTTACVADIWTRPGVSRDEKELLTCDHYRPGILCTCAVDILRKWATCIPKAESTLQAWLEGQVEVHPSRVTPVPWASLGE